MKIFWAMRAVIYKIFFGRFGLLSYIGKPIYLKNVKNVFVGRRVRIYPGARIEVISGGAVVIGDNVSIGQGLHLISGCEIKIEDDVTISANVFVSDVEHSYEEAGRHIMDQELKKSAVFVGRNSFLGYGSVLRAGARLGEHCIVGAYTVVNKQFPAYSVVVGNPARVIKKFNAHTGMWEKI